MFTASAQVKITTEKKKKKRGGKRKRVFRSKRHLHLSPPSLLAFGIASVPPSSLRQCRSKAHTDSVTKLGEISPLLVNCQASLEIFKVNSRFGIVLNPLWLKSLFFFVENATIL